MGPELGSKVGPIYLDIPNTTTLLVVALILIPSCARGADPVSDNSIQQSQSAVTGTSQGRTLQSDPPTNALSEPELSGSGSLVEPPSTAAPISNPPVPELLADIGGILAEATPGTLPSANPDFHLGTNEFPEMMPMAVHPPPNRSDPAAVAVYVAAVWGNQANASASILERLDRWVTSEFTEHHVARSSIATNPQASTSIVVDATSHERGNGTTVTVVLEQTTWTSRNTAAELSIVVIELDLILSRDGSWLVASLERS